jgi:hypothetical protein
VGLMAEKSLIPTRELRKKWSAETFRATYVTVIVLEAAVIVGLWLLQRLFSA